MTLSSLLLYKEGLRKWKNTKLQTNIAVWTSLYVWSSVSYSRWKKSSLEENMWTSQGQVAVEKKTKEVCMHLLWFQRERLIYQIMQCSKSKALGLHKMYVFLQLLCTTACDQSLVIAGSLSENMKGAADMMKRRQEWGFDSHSRKAAGTASTLEGLQWQESCSV